MVYEDLCERFKDCTKAEKRYHVTFALIDEKMRLLESLIFLAEMSKEISSNIGWTTIRTQAILQRLHF